MKTDNKLGVLDFIVIVLTLYLLGALIVDTFWKLPKETAQLLNYFDYFICTFFLIEFFFHFYK